jgi:hypothetical protein
VSSFLAGHLNRFHCAAPSGLIKSKISSDEDPAFKTGSHTYASWKQSDSIVDDEIDDIEIDEREIDREPSNALLDWIKKIYNAVFFYGLDTPTPSSRLRAKSAAKRKKKSMFFTAGEQFSQEIITDPNSLGVGAETSSKYLQSIANTLEAKVAENSDKLSVLDVSLESIESDGDTTSEEYRRLVDQRAKLLENNEKLQVQLVNTLAKLELA